jgi:hypothetical protein
VLTLGNVPDHPARASYLCPLPITELPGTDGRWRSGGAPAGPRCTEPGCPVRWRDGGDRPCADHQPPTGHGYRWDGDPDDSDDSDDDDGE